MGTLTISINSKTNQPPNSTGWLRLSLPYNTAHVFTLNNFTTETTPPYSDPEGDDLESIKITSLPSEGVLNLTGSPVSVNDIVSSSLISSGDLTYVPSNNVNGYVNGNMSFTVSDTGSSTFTSKPQVISIIVGDNINEAPSIIGDGQADVEVGAEFIFTRASLTSQLNPPYSDPEGDSAENLKVLSLPLYGVLELDGKEVFDGAIISFADIDLGLFIYKSDSLTIEGVLEGFKFEISDTGSGEYRG